MAKLVILSAGMTGRSHELKVDKTTIGRVEDNTFQISEPSDCSQPGGPEKQRRPAENELIAD